MKRLSILLSLVFLFASIFTTELTRAAAHNDNDAEVIRVNYNNGLTNRVIFGNEKIVEPVEVFTKFRYLAKAKCYDGKTFTLEGPLVIRRYLDVNNSLYLISESPQLIRKSLGDTFKQKAESVCQNHCANNNGKCGLNSYSFGQ